MCGLVEWSINVPSSPDKICDLNWPESSNLYVCVFSLFWIRYEILVSVAIVVAAESPVHFRRAIEVFGICLEVGWTGLWMMECSLVYFGDSFSVTSPSR